MVEKVARIRSGQELARRTAPVRVTIGLLYRLLGEAKEDQGVVVDRGLFESIIHTLELVHTDLTTPAIRPDEQRRLVDTPPARVASQHG